jgi:hypothetical protein
MPTLQHIIDFAREAKRSRKSITREEKHPVTLDTIRQAFVYVKNAKSMDNVELTAEQLPEGGEFLEAVVFRFLVYDKQGRERLHTFKIKNPTV